MEFSAGFIYNMTRPFCIVHSVHNAISLESHLTFDNNNIFNKSLVVDVTGDDVEIPSIARVYYENIIHDNVVYSSIKKVEKTVLPLYTNSDRQGRRTFDSIMKEFFCRVTYNQRLVKIITSKNEIYYGGYGLILDEGYNPLLMCGLKARKVIIENDEGVKVPSMQYYKGICHISPTVFTEPDKLVNKGIIKKLIPLYTTRDVCYPICNSDIEDNLDSRKVEVVIEDFSKFFITPIAPTPSKCSNDTLNKCLNDNIEDILSLI